MKFDSHSTCSLISHSDLNMGEDKNENLNYGTSLWGNRLHNAGQRKIGKHVRHRERKGCWIGLRAGMVLIQTSSCHSEFIKNYNPWKNTHDPIGRAKGAKIRTSSLGKRQCPTGRCLRMQMSTVRYDPAFLLVLGVGMDSYQVWGKMTSSCAPWGRRNVNSHGLSDEHLTISVTLSMLISHEPTNCLGCSPTPPPILLFVGRQGFIVLAFCPDCTWTPGLMGFFPGNKSYRLMHHT